MLFLLSTNCFILTNDFLSSFQMSAAKLIPALDSDVICLIVEVCDQKTLPLYVPQIGIAEFLI